MLELKKIQLLRRQRQRLQCRTNQNRLFSRNYVIVKLSYIAPARTFVAMDEEKLRHSFPFFFKVTMKCYKHVMLKKMLEKKWRAVELSIISYVESELLGPRGAFLATGYILLVFYAEKI